MRLDLADLVTMEFIMLPLVAPPLVCGRFKGVGVDEQPAVDETRCQQRRRGADGAALEKVTRIGLVGVLDR